MQSEKLDWLGQSLNYLILVYIFIKSLQSGTLNLFDMTISLVGLIASILIFINNHVKESTN